MINPEKKERKAAKKAQEKAKAEQKKRYSLYKEQRKHKLATRTMVCPPELSVPSSRKQFFGTLCRFLVVLFAVFALTFFVCDAFGYYAIDNPEAGIIDAKALFFWAFVTTALCALPYFIRQKYIALPITVLGLGLLCAYFFVLKNGLILPQDALLAAINRALRHMADIGYYALGEKLLPFAIDVGDTLALTPYIQAAVFAFLLLVALLYTTCLMRRIPLWKLLTAGIFSALILFVVFEYNITKSNWGVTFLIASFSGALVMAAYDFLFLRRSVVSEDGVFATKDAPALPAILARRREHTRNRKQHAETAAKKISDAVKPAAPKTIDEEISDYFATGKTRQCKDKTAKIKLTAAEKKQLRAEKRGERKELRAYRTYHSRKTAAACAAGGFAGFGMFLVAMLILFLPACLSTGPNTLFDRAGKAFEDYREYITAKLMGDEPALNTLAYEHDAGNFEDQDTSLHNIFYTGEKLMTVESNLRNAVYLRGWIGTTYSNLNGSWGTPATDSELYQYFRTTYGTESAPAEDMLYGFWNFTEPGSIPDPTEYDYTKLSKINSSLGLAVTQVNILREKDFKSKTLFLPAFTLPSGMYTEQTDNGKYARYLRQYGSAEKSKISYADIFDGIYSAYALTRKNDGIAAVSMLTTMKSQTFYRTLAENMANVHNYRTFLNGERSEITDLGNGYFSIPNDFGNQSVVFSPTYRNENGETVTVDDPRCDGCLYILMPQEVGTAVYKIRNREIVSSAMENIPEEKLVDEFGMEVFYRAPEFPLALRYFCCMSEEEQAATQQYLAAAQSYTEYVNRFYPTSQENAGIHELAEAIRSNATKTVSEPVITTDPETGEQYETSVSREVPADYSAAAKSALTGGASFNAESIRQRHELVMTVIDYLTDEENFTYTLTPQATTDESLIGVEQFLFGTQQGSCVQFATAAALILRDYGIPTRFVSGYIATNFTPTSGDDRVATYVSTVRDSSAHAWIEVWYDYVGWVQYECTPLYYGEVYNVPAEPFEPSYNPTEPVVDPEDEPPVIDPPAYTAEELAEMERQRQEAAFRAAVKKIVTIVLIVLAAAALIAVFFLYFLRKARKAQKKRDALVAKIASAGTEGAEIPTREEFRQLSDLTAYMMGLCRLSPKLGEFPDEYAARLVKDCSGALKTPVAIENIKEHEKTHYTLTQERMERMLGAISAEEFGFGADAADMPLLARFYRRMRAYEYPHRVSLFRRVWLWLFANKI